MTQASVRHYTSGFRFRSNHYFALCYACWVCCLVDNFGEAGLEGGAVRLRSRRSGSCFARASTRTARPSRQRNELAVAKKCLDDIGAASMMFDVTATSEVVPVCAALEAYFDAPNHVHLIILSSRVPERRGVPHTPLLAGGSELVP